MLAFSTSLGLAFVLLCAVMVFLIVLQCKSHWFDDETVDTRRYQIRDYDGVWFECTREEWLAHRSFIEVGVIPFQSSRILSGDPLI